MAGYSIASDEPEYVSEAQTAECLRIVREYTRNDSAKLYPPGHEGDYWCVSLEDSSEWAYDIANTEEWPDGVWVEPVYSWCLALHVR